MTVAAKPVSIRRLRLRVEEKFYPTSHRPARWDGLQVKANLHTFTDRGILDYTETVTLLERPVRDHQTIEAAGVLIETMIAAVFRWER